MPTDLLEPPGRRCGSHADGPTKNWRRWSSEDEQRSCLTTMVPSSKTTTASLIGGNFKKASRFAMKRAPHVELRVAPRRTPHRLDFGLAELVRLVVFRRSDGKPSNLAATCPWGRVSQIRCPHAPN